jgi:hypothetical protein
MLSPHELDVKHCLNMRLMQLLREEKIKWYQRSKSNKLLQGENQRNLHGNIMCCFCDSFETIQHLFIDCVLAKFIWRVIQVTFGLSTPMNIKHVLVGGYKE